MESWHHKDFLEKIYFKGSYSQNKHQKKKNHRRKKKRNFENKNIVIRSINLSLSLVSTWILTICPSPRIAGFFYNVMIIRDSKYKTLPN